MRCKKTRASCELLKILFICCLREKVFDFNLWGKKKSQKECMKQLIEKECFRGAGTESQKVL